MNPILFALMLLPLFSAAQCDTITGTIPVLPDFPASYSEISCYAFTPSRNLSATFEFTAENSSVIITAAHAEIGCDNVTLQSSYLLDTTTCEVIDSGSVFTGLVVGESYYWRVSYIATGAFCIGIAEICPYILYFNALPVELLDFTARSAAGKVKLNWSTVSEINSREFRVQRSGHDLQFVEIGIVQSHGNSNTRMDYELTDINPLPGENYYRLIEVDYNGDKVKYDPIFVFVTLPVVQSVINLFGQIVDIDSQGIKFVTYSDGTVIVLP